MAQASGKIYFHLSGGSAMLRALLRKIKQALSGPCTMVFSEGQIEEAYRFLSNHVKSEAVGEVLISLAWRDTNLLTCGILVDALIFFRGRTGRLAKILVCPDNICSFQKIEFRSRSEKQISELYVADRNTLSTYVCIDGHFLFVKDEGRKDKTTFLFMLDAGNAAEDYRKRFFETLKTAKSMYR